MRCRLIAIAVLAALPGVRSLSAQTIVATSAATPSPPLNLAWRTLGGEQFWSDELVYGRWRIQTNAITGQYRLLDEANVRRAWGTAEQCRAAFAELRQAHALPPLAGRAVITLHGFGRSREHMDPIGEHLEKTGRLTWINVSYASTRRSLDEHAESLARVISGLDGIDEIDFVCHSLGSLIVRRYLGEASQAEPRWKPDPRIKRMVMLGPPNNGARLAEVVAELLHDNEVARFVAGPTAWQLAREWEQARKALATPVFEFGVIAGGYGDNRGLNPLLKGDDDLVVSVAETRLPGASDFRVVNCRHGRLMSDTTVQQYVLSFLDRGCFTTPDERQPITAVDAPQPPAQP
jgi:pimeloyl-ACP methyl ester carboxylesterase